MPAKNSRKNYVENGYYHIYNRGVEKRAIFHDEMDHRVFLSYLKEYLSQKEDNDLRRRLSDPSISRVEKDKVLGDLRLNNFHEEILLVAYCLMPNHFHLFLKQNNPGSIYKFMNSLGTRYTMYFNRKYKRVGPLYEGRYKAVLITNEAQYLHLSRYIHRQAITGQNQPCSYPDYLGLRKTSWVHPEEILSCFAKDHPSLSYQGFVEDDVADSQEILSDVTLEF